MFGTPCEITGLQEVEVDLKEKASLSDLVAALRNQFPALDGSVIRTGTDRLFDNYGFNIKGRFYFDNGDVHLNDGDHVIIITVATGG